MLRNQQTFNDGIADIYVTGNVAPKGDMPVEGLTLKASLRFDDKTVGYNRFFAGIQNEVEIVRVISVPKGIKVSPQEIVIIDGEQYEVYQVQGKNDTLPPSKLLSLKRNEVVFGETRKVQADT